MNSTVSNTTTQKTTQTTTWKLDPAHTLVGFAAKHMMFTTVRGRFTTFEGTIQLNENDLAGSLLEDVVIETASIDSGDQKRDAHLRSADFFDADQYPTITFKSKRIEFVKGSEYNVIGDLTIKDITKEIALDTTFEGRASTPWGGEVIAISASTTINRKDFGLHWNVALETGGVLVGDTIKIEIEAEASRVQNTPA